MGREQAPGEDGKRGPALFFAVNEFLDFHSSRIVSEP